MAATLATARDQLESRLVDSTNLIFSTATLDEAFRASIAEVSAAYGSAVTLKDLDSAASTTFDDADLITVITGAHAYALRFRMIDRFEEASPIREHPEDLAQWANDMMNEFQGLLTHIRLRRFQESIDNPYTAWDWEDGDNFT